MLDDMLRMRSRALRDLSSDDILRALGLERARTPIDAALPTSLAFVAGLAAGAGIALLFAPKPGREMRQELSSRASELTGRLTSSANELAAEARNAVGTKENRALSGSDRTS